jgi:hypothetical protein
MYPPPESPAATPPDDQDLINTFLAGAVQAAAALTGTHQAIRRAAGQPHVAAELAEAAHALTRVRDAMLRAADEIAAVHKPP